MLVALLLVGCGGGTQSGPDLEGVQVLRKVEGREERVDLSTLKGSPVLLDFWATWCAPCRETMPIIEEMHQSYAGRGLQVLAISDETWDEVEAFKKDTPYTYNVYVDPLGRANDAFNVMGIPHAVVLDKNGVVLFAGHPGMREELRAAIEQALGS
jgi:cytochrome c biogenesis protein CcmG, thiol:disulfide interchange protein DsbE